MKTNIFSGSNSKINVNYIFLPISSTQTSHILQCNVRSFGFSARHSPQNKGLVSSIFNCSAEEKFCLRRIPGSAKAEEKNPIKLVNAKTNVNGIKTLLSNGIEW